MKTKSNKTGWAQFAAGLRLGTIIAAIVGFACMTMWQTQPPSIAVLGERLRNCAHAGHVDELRELLHQGVPVDQPDELGVTALMEACRRGNEECVEDLLDAGANVNTCAPVVSTPLMQAVINRQPAIVQILLEHGADPNLRAGCAKSALFWAEDFGDVEMVRQLVRHGAKAVHL